MADATRDTVTRDTVYFGYCGEVNTESVLHAVRERCRQLGIRTVVIASETGRSALRALDVLRDTGTELVVVTHYPATTWGPKGDIPKCVRAAQRQCQPWASRTMSRTSPDHERSFAPRPRPVCGS